MAEAIEPRILFSADNPGGLLAAMVSDATGTMVGEVRSLDPSLDVAPTAQQTRAVEYVYVDAAVPDAQGLVDAIVASRPDAALRIVLLEADRDALEQIGESLSGQQAVSAIHLVSHGQPGAIELSGRRLDAAAIDAAGAELMRWRTALSDTADLLIYGCDVAATPEGIALLQRLAAWTGADVAGSTNLTGTADARGDWTLEAVIGSIETAALFASGDPLNWSGELPGADVEIVPDQTNASPVIDNSASPALPALLEDATNPAGVLISSLVPDGAITDADVGTAPKAIAVTALDTSLGAWQYSTDSGASWLTISTALINSQTNELALLLGPDASIRLLPFANLNGTLATAITYRAWDMSAGAQGDYTVITNAGTDGSAFSRASETASVTVTAVNDAPTFFSGDGIVTTAIGTSNDQGRSVTMLPDGKILVGGYAAIGSTNDFALVRYNADGSLDTSFGTGGKVTGIGTGADVGNSVTVQADGKIIVGGYAVIGGTFDFALARYNADGSLDTSFGTGGIVTTDIGANTDQAWSVTVQADGKIVVGGNALIGGTSDLALVRYNANGTLDTSFGAGGIVTTAIDTGTDVAYSVTVQSDGRIVVGGYALIGGTDDFALVRYNADGSLDTSFGTGGIVTTDIGTDADVGYSVAVQADGKIVIGGAAVIDSNAVFAVVRYDADGSLDLSFGTSGKVTTAIGMSNGNRASVTVQSDGRIVVGGSAFISTNYDFALVRYNADGSLDTSFGTGGIVTTDIGTNTDVGYGVTVQADGKIVVGGFAKIGSTNDFALVRYNADGTLDTTFDPAATLGGAVAYTVNATAVVLDSNVRIFDAELSVGGSFSGATLTLVRNGGPNEQDMFSATGTLGALTQAGNLVVGGTTIGAVTTNSDGTLVLTFNSSATNALVNSAMQQIAYANSSSAPPATVQIDWTFGDGNTNAQGTGEALTATGYVTVAITGQVNVPPVITSDAGGTTASISVAENSTAVTIVTASDADLPAQTLTYSISGGVDAARFTIDSATGVLRFISAPDHESPTDADTNNVYEVEVLASDGTLSDTQALSIMVTGVNDNTPVITSNGGGASATVNVAENGVAVTTVTATDGDLSAQTLSYSITGGSDAARFTIDSATGVLRFVSAPDFESPTDADTNNVYQVQVLASDGTLSDTQALSITVTGVNDSPPVITNNGGASNASVSIAENSTAVITVTASDADLPAENLSYSIVGGSDAARFTIDAVTGVLRFVSAPDFESPTDAGGDNVYDVQVGVSDGALNDTQALSITVTGVNDNTPVITSNGGGASATVNAAENGFGVTTVTATDGDLPGQTLTYSISGGVDAARFIIDSASGVLRFVSAPDHESPTDADTNNVYEVQVLASDGTLSDTQALAVTVTGINDNAPVITSNGGGSTAAVSITEGDTAVTTLTARDDDLPTPALNFTISGGADAASFSIDAASGALRFNTAPARALPTDANADSIYEVEVRASDGLLSATQSLAVSVLPRNLSTPVIVSNGAGASASISIPENSHVVTTVIATDDDLPAQTLSYSIVGGADQSRFAIDSDTGVLRFMLPPDFEAPTDANRDHVYEVTVGASDGTLVGTQSLAVRVTDVPLVLSLTGPAALTTAEDTPRAVAGLNVAVFEGDIANVRLQASLGSLQFDLSGGASMSGSPASGSTVTLTGSQSQLQSALASLLFVPDADVNGVAALDTTLTAVTGETRSLSTLITITPVADLPVLALPGTQTVISPGQIAFGIPSGNAIGLVDPDTDNEPVRVQVSVVQGSLSLGPSEGVRISQASQSAGSALTLDGSVSAVRAALNTLVYQPNAGFVGDDTLAVSVQETSSPDAAIASSGSVAIVVRAAPLSLGQPVIGTASSGGAGVSGSTAASGAGRLADSTLSGAANATSAAGTFPTPSTTADQRADSVVNQKTVSPVIRELVTPTAASASMAQVDVIGSDASFQRIESVTGSPYLRPAELVIGARASTSIDVRVMLITAESIPELGAVAFPAHVGSTVDSRISDLGEQSDPKTDANRRSGAVELTLTPGVLVVGAAMSAGVLWAVRSGGTMLWLAVAYGPLARVFDPLPILANNRFSDDDDDSDPQGESFDLGSAGLRASVPAMPIANHRPDGHAPTALVEPA